MKYVIVYWSRYGNGKKAVEYLGGKLQAKGGAVQIFKTDEADPKAMPEADLYIFSAAQEAFNLQKNMRMFMKKLTGMDGRKYGLINTHAMKKKNQLKKMERLLTKKKMVKVAGVHFQVVDDFQSGNGLPTGWEAELDAFAGKL